MLAPPPEAHGEGHTWVRVIQRLAIYIRVNFDVEAEIEPIVVTITMPDGQVLHSASIEEQTVAKARATRDKGNPIGGLIQRLQLGSLQVNKLGRMTVEVTARGQTYLAGFLFFISEVD